MKGKTKTTRGNSTPSTNRRKRKVLTGLQIMAIWPLLSTVFTILCGLALDIFLKLAKYKVNILYLRV